MKLSPSSLRIPLLILALLVAALFAPRLGGLLFDFARWVDGLGFWGPVLFVLGYVVVTVALIPASILTMAAGAIFGLGKGFVLVLIGAFLGGALSFWLARTAAQRPIQRLLTDRPGIGGVERAVSANGRRVIFLLRLSPVMPFGLLNYACGLTSVRFKDFIIGHLGIFPGTLLYIYYGTVLGSLAAVAAGEIDRGLGYWLVLGLGLVATAIATWQITRIARRALAEENVEPVQSTTDDPDVEPRES